MTPLKIGFDVDGVLAPFHETLVDVYNYRYNDNLTIHQLDGELENLSPERFKKIIEIFNEPNWFANLVPYPEASDVIYHLDKYTDLYQSVVCTAPARDLNGLVNPLSAAEKFAWVKQWFPLLSHNVIVTKYKSLIKVDILVDDTAKNIISWCEEHPTGIGYLIDQPWNRKFTNLPMNGVRGSLKDTITFIDKFWCKDRNKFIYRLDELKEWK